jgi:hypothetical protein
MLVLFERLDVSLLGKMRRALEFAIFLKNGINAGIGGNGCLVCHQLPRDMGLVCSEKFTVLRVEKSPLG